MQNPEFTKQSLVEPIADIFELRTDPWHGPSKERFADSPIYGLAETARKKEFFKNPDILVIGCSMSSSNSLPLRFSWPNIVSFVTKERINNVAECGASVAYSISLAIDNINKYGMPKKVYFFLPDFQRFSIPVMENIAVKKNFKKLGENTNAILENQIHWIYDQYFDAMKRNLFVFKDFQKQKHTLPQEIAIYHNLMSLKTLTTLCEQTSTELKISSWSGETFPYLEKISKNHFIKPDIKYRKAKDKIDEYFGDCTSDDCGHTPTTELQKELWLKAEDGDHAGLHHQIHFAEMFIGKKIFQHTIEAIG